MENLRRTPKCAELDGDSVVEQFAALKAEIHHEAATIRKWDVPAKRLCRALHLLQEFILNTSGEQQSAAYGRKREAQENLKALDERAARKGGGV